MSSSTVLNTWKIDSSTSIQAVWQEGKGVQYKTQLPTLDANIDFTSHLPVFQNLEEAQKAFPRVYILLSRRMKKYTLTVRIQNSPVRKSPKPFEPPTTRQEPVLTTLMPPIMHPKEKEASHCPAMVATSLAIAAILGLYLYGNTV